MTVFMIRTLEKGHYPDFRFARAKFNHPDFLALEKGEAVVDFWSDKRFLCLMDLFNAGNGDWNACPWANNKALQGTTITVNDLDRLVEDLRQAEASHAF